MSDREVKFFFQNLTRGHNKQPDLKKKESHVGFGELENNTPASPAPERSSGRRTCPAPSRGCCAGTCGSAWPRSRPGESSGRFVRGALLPFLNLLLFHRFYPNSDLLSRIEWNFTRIWVTLSESEWNWVKSSKLEWFFTQFHSLSLNFTQILVTFHSILLKRSEFE